MAPLGIDLLVFGPHPDDLEIGLGGTIARHVDLGSTVGLCDMTAGEMGSNGTVEQRRSRSAGRCSAAWREISGCRIARSEITRSSSR
jgi:LmbE family N-acetylglucosaminyl deacetylase